MTVCSDQQSDRRVRRDGSKGKQVPNSQSLLFTLIYRCTTKKFEYREKVHKFFSSESETHKLQINFTKSEHIEIFFLPYIFRFISHFAIFLYYFNNLHIKHSTLSGFPDCDFLYFNNI